MRRFGLASALCAYALLQPAVAGPYSDDLSRCLVSATSPADKTALVRWIFSNAAVHPDVASIAAITDARRTEINQAMGQLVTRLLTEQCRTQVRDAVQYEGEIALNSAFEVLGQAAMIGLMSDPEVGKSFNALVTYLDNDKLEQVFKAPK